MTDLRYLAYLLLPVLSVIGYYWGGWGNFLVPLLCFVARPLLNIIPVKKNSPGRIPQTSSDFQRYHAVLLVYVPVLMGLNFWAVIICGTHTLKMFEWAGLCISIGIINGILGFTLAHEFIHRFTDMDQLAGHLLLWMNNYLQYSIEHLGGHHRYACTPKDPHTARLNESIYAFLPRSIIGTWHNAWEIECHRLNRKKLPILSRYNRLLWYLAIEFTTVLAIVLVFDLNTGLFFLVQSLIAIVLLNIVEYLQHYGLVRAQSADGRYERIGTLHAWNTRLRSTNLGLFHLESHSEHHMHPNKIPAEKNQHSHSPEHPAGYILMIWLALIPPQWFRIMNPRIDNLTNKNR